MVHGGCSVKAKPCLNHQFPAPPHMTQHVIASRQALCWLRASPERHVEQSVMANLAIHKLRPLDHDSNQKLLLSV